MKPPHPRLRVSLLLLTFAASTLACGSQKFNPEVVDQNDFCEVDFFPLGHEHGICPSQVSKHSLHKKGSSSRDQIPIFPNEEDLEDSTAPHPPSPFYTILPIPSKGLGLLATIPIPHGTRLILEAPLLTIPSSPLTAGQGHSLTALQSSLSAAFSSLPLASQNIIIGLHNHRFPGDSTSTPPNSDLLTIFRSNAYNTGTDPSTSQERVGLFPLIARINHSCRPNSVNYWSERLQRRIIYAGRDIAPGDEITVSYIPLLKPTKDRQQRLSQYGFVCSCEACAGAGTGAGGEGSKGKGESDKRRSKIADLMDVLEQKVQVPSEKKLVNERLAKRAQRLLGLLEEEKLVELEYLTKALRFGAVFEGRAGNLEGARDWVEREVEVLKMAEEESTEIQRAVEFLDRLGM